MAMMTASQRNARYRKKHPERVRIKNNVWHENHPLYAAVKLARIRAKEKGLPFDLDDRKIFRPSHCPVFGVELDYSRGTKKRAQDNSPSLDRIVPELGYVLNNVRVICWRANHLRSNATVEELKKVLTYAESCALLEKPIQEGS
jgi:hypothetical protein